MSCAGKVGFCEALSPCASRRPRVTHQSASLLNPLEGRRRWYSRIISNRAVVSAALSVALTREAEKNGALRNALSKALPEVECINLPCVRTVPGPDSSRLPAALSSQMWAWVIITSPEAASVLSKAWESAGKPSLRIAAVGVATSRALTAAGLEVAFVPNKATGKALVEEFVEVSEDESSRGIDVLYPSSALASTVVPDGLKGKGFRVTRLDTYSTEVADWSPVDIARATEVDVVSFAAPSAVKSWVSKAGVCESLHVACIGETSASAAVAAGFPEENVFFPEKPGLVGWVEAVGDAIDKRKK